MSLQVFLTGVIEKAINRYLLLDPDYQHLLQPLVDKVIEIRLLDLNFSLFFLPSEQDIRIMSTYQGEADVIISGTALELFKMLSMRDDAKAMGNIQLQGNITLAQDFKRFWSLLEVDWEEVIAKYTGDVVAHEVGNKVRSFKTWESETRETVRMNISEYLQEEIRLTPGKIESEQFYQDVDTLRSQVDRLEARIMQLEGRLKGTL